VAPAKSSSAPWMIGGVVVVVAVIAGYLAAQNIGAENDLDMALIHAQFAGNLGITRDAIKQCADRIGPLRHISKKDAIAIADGMAKTRGMTPASLIAGCSRSQE
jgi:hypothetical protein